MYYYGYTHEIRFNLPSKTESIWYHGTTVNLDNRKQHYNEKNRKRCTFFFAMIDVLKRNHIDYCIKYWVEVKYYASEKDQCLDEFRKVILDRENKKLVFGSFLVHSTQECKRMTLLSLQRKANEKVNVRVDDLELVSQLASENDTFECFLSKVPKRIKNENSKKFLEQLYLTLSNRCFTCHQKGHINNRCPLRYR